MSQKKDKKIRKEYRNQVSQYMSSKGLLELYQLIIKPKPRWMPKFIWMWGIKLFINVQEDWDNAGERVSDKRKKVT